MDQKEVLAVSNQPNQTQTAGFQCSAVLDPCCCFSCFSCFGCARPFSRETNPVGYIQLDRNNDNGYRARQNQGKFPTRIRGEKNYIVLVGDIMEQQKQKK